LSLNEEKKKSTKKATKTIGNQTIRARVLAQVTNSFRNKKMSHLIRRLNMPSRRHSLFLGLGQGDEGQEGFNHSLVIFSFRGSKGSN